MQAFRWSGNNAALVVWVLTSGFPWVLEWPCWFAFEDLEGEGESVRWIAASAVTSKGEGRAVINATAFPHFQTPLHWKEWLWEVYCHSRISMGGSYALVRMVAEGDDLVPSRNEI